MCRARELVLIYCNNGNTEARTFNLILKILFTKQRKNRFRGYILMYILVLFNEKKSIKLPRSRRREGVCQVLRNTIFLKKQRKTLVCDLLRRALSKKYSKIVRRQESYRRILGSIHHHP